jgi:membrane-associated phospholipid phosphatase
MSDVAVRGKARTWWPEIGVVAGFGALTGALAAGLFLGVDVAVRDWCDTHQVWLAHFLARGAIVLGSGNVVAPVVLAVAVVVAVRRRSVRPVLPVVAAVVLANLVLVPLKMLGDRAAPHSPVPDPARLFHHPPGWSYPSGHAANSVYLFGVLVLVLDGLVRPAAGRVLRVVPPVLVSATFIYLGYHWLTDIAAGLLLGVLLDRLLRRIPWDGATSRPD